MAHEISHFWWTGAPTVTWEDWLNESFAEYTALMVTREVQGREVYEELLTKKKEQSKDAPPIRGLDRDSEEAYTVLYSKGPVMLGRLESEMGQEPFLALLREFATQDERSTELFLDLLERRSSRTTKEMFSRLLQE
jgi:aminopeptidase N